MKARTMRKSTLKGWWYPNCLLCAVILEKDIVNGNTAMVDAIPPQTLMTWKGEKSCEREESRINATGLPIMTS